MCKALAVLLLTFINNDIIRIETKCSFYFAENYIKFSTKDFMKIEYNEIHIQEQNVNSNEVSIDEVKGYLNE